MKNKILIIMFIFSLVLISGCGYKVVKDTGGQQQAQQTSYTPPVQSTGISRGEAESIAWDFANNAYLSDCSSSGCRSSPHEIKVVDSTQMGDKWKVVAYYFIDRTESRKDPDFNLPDVKVTYSIIIDKRGNIESSNVISSTY